MIIEWVSMAMGGTPGTPSSLDGFCEGNSHRSIAGWFSWGYPHDSGNMFFFEYATLTSEDGLGD